MTAPLDDDALNTLTRDLQANYLDAWTRLAQLVDEVRGHRADPHDEYHSMSELYDYRMLYNAHAARGWAAAGIPVVRSWRHSDGELCFGGGWFIVTATLPTGQVSNHYKADAWGLFDGVPEVLLPPAYDGHSPAVAADRLRAALGAGGTATPALARREERVEAAARALAGKKWDTLPALDKDSYRLSAIVALAAADAVAHPTPVIDATHLARQIAFSERTFGPGRRTKGIVDHIEKELDEVLDDPDDVGEWVDIVILGLDGAWRTGTSPQAVVDAIVAKQTVNEARTWPDWRTVPAGRAIEHNRTGERPS